MTRRRRALRWVLPTVFAWLAAGCSPGREAIDRTDYGAGSHDEGSSSEADRTEAMEGMAERMNADLQEAIEDADSEQDLERAYQQFEASREELNDLAESDDFDESDDSDEYAPEP